MTLEKAIEFYEFWADAHERDAEYHRPLGYSHETIANVTEMQAREERQIAEWLKELKAYSELCGKTIDESNISNYLKAWKDLHRKPLAFGWFILGIVVIILILAIVFIWKSQN